MPSEIKRPNITARRAWLIAAALVCLLAALLIGARVFVYTNDIDLDVAVTGTQRRPIVVVNGKVTQMPSGDYLAANTLVDTTGCSSTNVVAWNGTQFACAAAGGGGGGITNSAGANVVMKSNGTNAVASSLSDDGTTVTTAETAYFSNSGISAKFGHPTFGLYINSNVLNAGFGQNGLATMYFNYDGYNGLGAQPRDTCFMDGQEHASPCIMYTSGSTGRVGIHTNGPNYQLEDVGSFGVTPTAGGPGGFFLDAAAAQGHYTQTNTGTNGGFGFNVSVPTSPVDISNDPQTGRTDENPLFIHELTNGSLATYDTTAADRRAYGNFWDMSPIKSAGTHLLTSVTLRLDARAPNKPVALWLDEGETWQDTHVMYNVRPNGGGAGPPTVVSCGTSPSVNGNDNMGRITVGSGTVNACTITFAQVWEDHTQTGITPACLVTDENGTSLAITPTTSNLAITCSACQGHHIVYHCSGTENNLAGP